MPQLVAVKFFREEISDCRAEMHADSGTSQTHARADCHDRREKFHDDQSNRSEHFGTTLQNALDLRNSAAANLRIKFDHPRQNHGEQNHHEAHQQKFPDAVNLRENSRSPNVSRIKQKSKYRDDYARHHADQNSCDEKPHAQESSIREQNFHPREHYTPSKSFFYVP